MNVYDRRRAVLLLILKQMRASELSKRTGIAASTLTRYQYEPGQPNAKNISEENARKFDAAMRKPEGWMDRPETLSLLQRGEAVGSVAHVVSYQADTVPTLTREALKAMKEVPEEFWLAMDDDAMTPSAGQGVRVKFTRASEAKPGDAALIEDAEKNVYFREVHKELDGSLTGRPTNTAYPTIPLSSGHYRVVAVFSGINVSWANLRR